MDFLRMIYAASVSSFMQRVVYMYLSMYVCVSPRMILSTTTFDLIFVFSMSCSSIQIRWIKTSKINWQLSYLTNVEIFQSQNTNGDNICKRNYGDYYDNFNIQHTSNLCIAIWNKHLKKYVIEEALLCLIFPNSVRIRYIRSIIMNKRVFCLLSAKSI